MKLTFMWKDADSGGGGCPAIYDTDEDDYIVQGWEVGDDVVSQLRDFQPGERPVAIPKNVIDRIRGGK